MRENFTHGKVSSVFSMTPPSYRLEWVWSDQGSQYVCLHVGAVGDLGLLVL